MLGPFLRALRERAQLSVSDVVERMTIPRSTAYYWEGPLARPAPEHLQALLDLYDASPEERLRAWELRAAAPTSGDQPGEAA